jgi:hypothetical protein
MMGVVIGKEATAPKQMQKYQEQVRATLASDECIRQAILLLGLSGLLQSDQGLMVALLKPDRGKTTIQEVARDLSKLIRGYRRRIRGSTVFR